MSAGTMTHQGKRPHASFAIRRAESEYQRRDREREAAQKAADKANADRHARSVADAEEAHRRLSSPYSSLSHALAWFRHEWQAALPQKMHEGADRIEPLDVSGAPAWTEWFRSWLDTPLDPLRRAGLWMASSGSLFDRVGWAYLFRLACLDFNVLLAASRMDDPIGVAYAPWYTEQAIDRLRECMVRVRDREPSRIEKPEWIERLGIGKSDAQHAAEDAA